MFKFDILALAFWHIFTEISFKKSSPTYSGQQEQRLFLDTRSHLLLSIDFCCLMNLFSPTENFYLPASVTIAFDSDII